MADTLLCLNSGSSSLKFGLYERDDGLALRARGKIEKIGIEPYLLAKSADGEVIAERRWAKAEDMSHESLLAELLAGIEARIGHDLVGVGHRVVHGGANHAEPVRVTQALLTELARYNPLAPLHQPHNLSAIHAVAALRPGIAQVAVFDTAFHQTQPPVATRIALPRHIIDEGVRRYGFHGISYEYVAQQLGGLDPALLGGRVIAAHLGNGASLCAMQAGRSIDTTMGFTALDGLVMGSRCGNIDPGVLLYLFQQDGMDAARVENLLYRESGLLGVSGLSSDMRTLFDSDAPAAKEAIELFVYRVARESGALIASLGGLDGIVFTAGIGENSPEIRSLICARLSFLGIELDEAANRANAAVISTPASRIAVRVIPTDEERMIALHTDALLTREAA
ncbi:acetate/propionate family kinase [Sandaracinobacter neustonicus]|uniref:Acetate kinase n=1 Tax=Sandaracinobacter neustonicus TaxID=1715348 RepID=A0A501XME5_9SPHN|nr:acetate/propionate family kinase [Sandaracinobacter neustonicus]TPE61736.1 acetate/propionate family kinase [Sandaracinobacter neustonicus]